MTSVPFLTRARDPFSIEAIPSTQYQAIQVLLADSN